MGEAKRKLNGNGGDVAAADLPGAHLAPSVIPPGSTITLTPATLTKPTRKILVSVPSYTGKLDNATVVAFGNASMEVAPLGWQTVLSVRAGDSILPRCRDVLVSQFWYSDCTDMMMVDSDISWEPGAFTRIMSHPVEFVGGVYRGRGDPPSYVCTTLEPGKLDVDYPIGLAKVRGVGTGFLRITRSAVERLIKWLPENYWYHDDFTAPGMKIHHFFDFTFDPTQDPGMRFRGEDFVFCDRFRAAGGTVYADVELTLHHAGMQSWTGHFGDYLRAGGGAPASAVGAQPGMSLVQAIESMVGEAVPA